MIKIIDFFKIRFETRNDIVMLVPNTEITNETTLLRKLKALTTNDVNITISQYDENFKVIMSRLKITEENI